MITMIFTLKNVFSGAKFKFHLAHSVQTFRMIVNIEKKTPINFWSQGQGHYYL
jgi:hypothetical protein